MKLTKKTSLEKSLDIKDTLEWKTKTIEDSGLPMESGIADYISFAVDNLESELKYIETIQDQMSEKKNSIKEQIKSIKIEGAKFLIESGIDKIEGTICSSITITSEKQEVTTETTKKVFNALISNAEIAELLIGLGKAEMRTQVTSKTSDFIPAKLRINKHQKKKEEIIEVEVKELPIKA